jgi:hypothetical protein
MELFSTIRASASGSLTDKTSQKLLDRFEVKTGEAPVVICNG